MTSSVKAAGMRAGEADPLEPLDVAAGAQQLRRRRPVAELHAIGVDILAEQGDLDDALGDKGLDLGEDLAGAAVLLLAAQARDDAEGARVVAADGDRDPPGIRAVAARRARWREDLEGFEDLDLGALVVPGAVEQRRERADVVGAEDDIDPRGALDDGAAVLLSQAAADGDLQSGFAAWPGAGAEIAVELVVGVLAHRAGVEDDDIGDLGPRSCREAGDIDIARRLEHLAARRVALGVVDVHLAAVGAHVA
jgi:hypothetical protein